MIKKILIVVITISLFGALLASCAPPETEAKETEAIAVSQVPQELYPSNEQMKLNVLNWSDYLDDRMITLFKNQYPNIELRYDTAESNEEMLSMLQDEGSIYDVCILSDYAIGKLKALNLLSELDQAKLPNVINVSPDFLDCPFDVGNKYSVPYMWGTVGILYNKNMVKETVDSWNILWDEQYAKKILMYDSIRDSIGLSLKRLGYSMNTKNAQELAKAETELLLQKPLVLAYSDNEITDMMINEEAALAVMFSGDAMMCMDENPNLDYVIPKEGSNIWIDSFVILKNGKNKEAAHMFVDFLKRGYISQFNTEYIGYSTPDRAVLPFLNEELKNNRVFNPSQDTISRCEGFQDLGDFEQHYSEAWERVKAESN